MNDVAYVVFSKTGIDRLVKRLPIQLKPGEKAFVLNVEIPDEVFAPPPMPTVRMTIPKEALIHEISVQAEPEEVS